jgi:hypothetical protein
MQISVLQEGAWECSLYQIPQKSISSSTLDSSRHVSLSFYNLLLISRFEHPSYVHGFTEVHSQPRPNHSFVPAPRLVEARQLRQRVDLATCPRGEAGNYPVQLLGERGRG